MIFTSNITWYKAENLYLVFLIGLVVLIYIAIRKTELTAFKKLGSNYTNLLAHRYHYIASVFRLSMLGMFIVCIVIALSGPRGDYTIKQIETIGRNILVAVDVSTSMLATDVKPSRLEQAKREIIDLIDVLDGDRIGIIIFAGSAYTHLPLTTDYGIAKLFVDSLSPDLIANQGSDLSKAIAEALTSLKDSDSNNQSFSNQLESRDLIIITDGESHSQDVISMANKAKEANVRIFTIGIGSDQGSPLMQTSGRYLRDRSGNIVISKLDQETLQKISAMTKGIYVKSSVGDQDLNKIYFQGIESEGSDKISNELDKIWQEFFPYFLGASIVFLLLSVLISPYRFKPMINHMIIIGFSLFFSLFSFNDDHFKAYGWILQKPSEQFNLAVDILKNSSLDQQQLSQAKELLIAVCNDQNSSKHLKHACYYNLSQIYIKESNFSEALLALKQAYDLNSNHSQTIDNLKWLVEMLDIKKDQQQPNNNKQNNQQNNQLADNNQANQTKESSSQHSSDQSSNQENSKKHQEFNNNSAQSDNNSDSSQENSNKNQQDHDQSLSDQLSDPQDDFNQDQNSANANNNDLDQDQLSNNDNNNHSNNQSLQSDQLDSQKHQNKELSLNNNNQQNQHTQHPNSQAHQLDQLQDPDTLSSEEASALFQQLEDNLKAYGIKRKDVEDNDSRNSKKNW